MSKLTSAKAGVPKAGRKVKIELKGIGKPKRDWKPGPVIQLKPLQAKRLAAARAHVLEEISNG